MTSQNSLRSFRAALGGLGLTALLASALLTSPIALATVEDGAPGNNTSLAADSTESTGETANPIEDGTEAPLEDSGEAGSSVVPGQDPPAGEVVQPEVGEEEGLVPDPVQTGSSGEGAPEEGLQPELAEWWIDTPNDAGGDPSVSSNGNAETGAPTAAFARAATLFDSKALLAAWDPGFILSDRAMYTSSLITEDGVKALIQREGAGCVSGGGKTCLKDKTIGPVSLKSKFADKGYGCKALTLPAGTPSWKAIKAVGDACEINPQVLLVFIQKESSGIAQAKTDSGWDWMMGMGCPDNQPCKTDYKGFTAQLYYGADALTSYRYRDFKYNNSVRQGVSVAIPNASNYPDTCGTQSVRIRNQATASLYTYNPAAPTRAALDAYPGTTGNVCDSYGQRNVYMYMWKWFPETMQDHPAASPKAFATLPTPVASGAPFVGAKLTVASGTAANFSPSATSVSYQWLRAGSPISGATGLSYTLGAADRGKAISVRVTGSREGYVTASSTSGAIVVRGDVSRLAGGDRYSTNLAVNRQPMKAGAPLFVATGLDFADALAVSPAVTVQGGSLLLSRTDSIDAQSLELIKSRKPSKIYVVGGTGAVSERVVASLKSATGISAKRVGGSDRYETSAAILKEFFSARSVPKVFVATGADFPDALTASAAGGALSTPVLLVEGTKGTVAPSALVLLKEKKTRDLVAVGGTAVVTDATMSKLVGAVPGSKSTRLGGTTRYLTNLAVNDYVTKTSGQAPTGLWVATGKDFPDALSSAIPAGKSTQRLVLSQGTCLPSPVVTTWIGSAGSAVSAVTLVGGVAVLEPPLQQLVQCG